MNSKLLLLASLMSASLAAHADNTTDRQIHGINGYYNWTAQQMQSDGFVEVDKNTGNKDKNFLPAISFDGGYLNDTLGVADASKDWWRSTVYFNYRAQKSNIKIAKKYPVIAFKFSLSSPAKDSTECSVTVEHWWKKPYDGTTGTFTNKTGLGINGIQSNGRMTYMAAFPNKKIQNADHPMAGRDSVKIGWEGNSSKYRKTDSGVVYAMRDTKVNGVTIPTWAMAVLPTDNTDKCEYIAMMNYGSIEDTVSVENGAAESKLLLDRTDIESVGFHIMFFGYNPIEQGQPAPAASIKWAKTFTSIEEAMNSLTAENNWGDGTESVAKTQLNYALYYAENILAGYIYRNSDPDSPDDADYIAYQTAYTEANAIYSKADATDAEFEAATQKLTEARIALLAATNPDKSLVYNYVKSASGNGSIVVGNDDVTVGSLTGKALTIGSKDAASPLSFVATGNVSYGQKTYRLQSGSANVVQASDGTLLLSESQAGSEFTFSERDTEGHGFDIKCGNFYYYIDNNGVLSATEEIPAEATKDFDALSAYLFTIEDALADYAANAAESEKTGLSEGWEFNSEPVEDPSTRGLVDGQEKIMAENGETKMIDGWRMSRWRAFSRVNQETLKNTDGTEAKCLVLTSAATYDNWDGSQTGVVNDFTTAAALRMDGGKQEPFYVRDPSPRDSTYAYNVNAGIKRYLAIKMKGTDDVSFGSITIFGANKSVGVGSANIAGQKGDVVYIDLLQSGFAVGKDTYTSLFWSPEGFTSAESKLAIDWVRFYDTVEAIPEESFDTTTTGIDNVTVEKATGNNHWFNLNGQRIAQPNAKGIYILNGKKVIKK